MTKDSGYLLGHDDREIQRLLRQGALAEQDTAGLSPGMQVLDLGSGLGDVAMLAGRIVRPGGQVLGIERSDASIALAEKRVAAIADIDVRFEAADLDAYEPRQKFDALIGRFVLAYLKDPSTTLQRLSRHIRAGGILVMMEFDNRALGVSGHSDLFQNVIGWIVGAFEGSGVNPSLGSDLGRVFHDAGLPWPRMKNEIGSACRRRARRPSVVLRRPVENPDAACRTAGIGDRRAGRHRNHGGSAPRRGRSEETYGVSSALVWRLGPGAMTLEERRPSPLHEPMSRRHGFQLRRRRRPAERDERGVAASPKRLSDRPARIARQRPATCLAGGGTLTQIVSRTRRYPADVG
jgi:SAM-dependent methyltransferase